MFLQIAALVNMGSKFEFAASHFRAWMSVPCGPELPLIGLTDAAVAHPHSGHSRLSQT